MGRCRFGSFFFVISSHCLIALLSYHPLSPWLDPWLLAGHAEWHLHRGRRDRPQQQGQRHHLHHHLVKQKLIPSKYPPCQIWKKGFEGGFVQNVVSCQWKMEAREKNDCQWLTNIRWWYGIWVVWPGRGLGLGLVDGVTQDGGIGFEPCDLPCFSFTQSSSNSLQDLRKPSAAALQREGWSRIRWMVHRVSVAYCQQTKPSNLILPKENQDNFGT